MMPTSHASSTASKIHRRIVVGIGCIAAELTGELTLTDTVTLVDMSTTGAGLRTIASIDKRNRDPFGRCFIGDKMICIVLKSFQFARELLQVSLSRLCTFALQSTSEAEIAVIRFFEMFTRKETRMRSHGKAIDAKINTDHLTFRRGRESSLFARDNHVQPVAALAIDQISAVLLPLWRHVLLIVGRDFDGNGCAIACLSCLLDMHEGNQTAVAIKAEGTRIIADSTQSTVRGLCQFQGLVRLALLDQGLILLSLLLPSCNHAFESFGRFHSSRTNQLRGKMGRSTVMSIGEPMQLDAVTHLLSIAQLTDLIKAHGVRLHRLLQEYSLLKSWLQLYPYRPCQHHGHVLLQYGTKIKSEC